MQNSLFKIRFFKFLALLSCSLVSQTLFAGEGKTLSAKQDNVQVFSQSSKDSSVLTTLKTGEVVNAKDRKGMFWEVTLGDGRTGYVSITAMKPHEENQGQLGDMLRNAVQENRTDEETAVRARSAVMGVRGLDDSDETKFAGDSKPNLRMVYDMEKLTIARKDIDKLGNEVMKEIDSSPRTNGSH